MDEILPNSNNNSFSSDIEENLYAFYRSFEKNGHAAFHQQDGLSMVISNSAGWPGFILGNNSNARSFPVLIKFALAGIKKKEFPPFWILRANEGQEDVFKQEGFHLVNRWNGMGLLLDQPVYTPPASGEFNIHEVTDIYQAENWFSVVKPEVLGNYDLSLEQFSSLANEAAFRLYVGYLGQAPVCSALLFFTGDVAGLYFVATSKVFRNRGFGTAITSHAIHQAKMLGYRKMVLHATRKAENIYSRLGFRSFCYMNIFWFPPVH